jgi:hypothetical protein
MFAEYAVPVHADAPGHGRSFAGFAGIKRALSYSAVG